MKKTKHVFFSAPLLIAYLLFSHGSSAQSGTNSPAQTAFSLKQAQEYALKTNLNNANAEIDIKLARARKNEIQGIGYPQISGNFDVKDFIEIPTSLIPGAIFGAPAGTFIPVQFGTRYQTTAGLQISQIIFSSDYLVGLQASKAYLELSEKAMKRSQNESNAAVAKAYLNVLVNRERTRLLDANIERLEKLQKDTKALQTAGFVEAIDVDRIELAFNNLQTEKEKIQRLLGLTETLLKFQMGYDIAQPISLSDSLSMFSSDLVDITWNNKPSVSGRPEYGLLESQIKLQELDLKRNRLSYLPTLAAYGSLSAMAMRNEFDVFSGIRWFPTALIGGTLNVPVFDGLQKNYRIEQAKLNLLKSRNGLKSFEQAATLEINSAGITYQNALSSLKSQQRNIELAKNVYRVTKTKYEQGIGSNLEVVTAETALKEAETNYYSALYDALVARVDYQKATGTLK
jgi:outer membrane protein TolC